MIDGATGEMIAAEALARWESPELGAVESRFRTALVVQIAGVVVIAVLVVLFANWISKPYRRIARAAGRAGPPRIRVSRRR